MTDVIKTFEINTNYYYCGDNDIDTIMGKNNIIIYDNRKKIKYYNDLYHEQQYNYLHISKLGDITLKDIIVKMSVCPFYIDPFINNEYVFLEGFDKITDVQYNVQFGKWTNIYD